MNKKIWIAGMMLASLCAMPVVAQEHGGGGGGGGCGDVFGDLIHVLRDDVTGQPILQKRWIELPKEIPGYGWGYCAIAVDEDGEELAFAPLSCDVAEGDLERVIEVDYFGRLNGGRTKERNNRMHFNEVISSIKAAGLVKQEAAARLTLGYDCAPNAGGQVMCAEWTTVDSPMESIGLFTRLMKYGHFQTDPLEVDPWFHGDPALPTPYHPALGPEDWEKFHPSVRHLLPAGGDVDVCFPEDASGVRSFASFCADPESLDQRDFTRAGSFLGAAANKTGKVTRDLVQYFGRFMKITLDTEHTVATLDTLPALVRTCPTDPPAPDPDDEDQQEPVYFMDDCEIVDADAGLPNYDLFPDVQERFVDFDAAEYVRSDWRDEEVEIVRPDPGIENGWREDAANLIGWLNFVHGPEPESPAVNLEAFVRSGADALRSIQFLHNYRVPEDLGWNFDE